MNPTFKSATRKQTTDVFSHNKQIIVLLSIPHHPLYQKQAMYMGMVRKGRVVVLNGYGTLFGKVKLREM